MMFKRIFLFILTNFLVITTISIILNLLGVNGYLTENGIDYSALIIFCSVWGMGGAFISLLLSKTMAKWMMGVKIINPNSISEYSGEYASLLATVESLVMRANLPMPEVGVYESSSPNAFATGATKSSSLVAVSTGLLHSMDKNELEGVLAHEISHIANGDMVTMTLLQGVINAFVMVLSRLLAQVIMRNSDRRGETTWLVVLLQIMLSILGSLVVCWFSRQREYRADKGSADLAGRQKMIAALRALQKTVNLKTEEAHESFASLQISSKPSFWSLFSTHPDLEDRIKALENNYV
ncbi:MAG: protease HtpX [Deltaproteobacteria bacterium]|nr:protease HtpX [Deltaproteobacteria bacterium]